MYKIQAQVWPLKTWTGSFCQHDASIRKFEIDTIYNFYIRLIIHIINDVQMIFWSKFFYPSVSTIIEFKNDILDKIKFFDLIFPIMCALCRLYTYRLSDLLISLSDLLEQDRLPDAFMTFYDIFVQLLNPFILLTVAYLPLGQIGHGPPFGPNFFLT